MKVMNMAIWKAVILFCAAQPAFAIATYMPPAGYQAKTYYSYPGRTIQSFDFDSAGRLYLLTDNQYVIRQDGNQETVLYDYGTPTWGSFLAVSGDAVCFGESMTGTIRSVSTSDGSSTTLFSLAGNFDLAFNSTGQIFVSANPAWTGNSIYYYDGSELDLVADAGGYSGPLAFDRNDNLYYGTSGGEAVYYTAQQIADAISSGIPGSAELTRINVALYAEGLSVPGGFAFDDDSGIQDLFSTSWIGTVQRVYGPGLLDPFGDPFDPGTSPSFVRFRAGAGNFEPYGGTDGGHLYLLTTDWGSNQSTIFEVTPVPEPSACVLVLGGLLGFGVSAYAGCKRL
jgi:hypothetical protein